MSEEKNVLMKGATDDAKFIASTICYLSQFAELDGQVPASMTKAAKCLELASNWDEETLGVISALFGYCKDNGLEVKDSFLTMRDNLNDLAGCGFIKWKAKMKIESVEGDGDDAQS